MILDNIGQLINQGFVSKIASRLGEPEENVSRGLHAGTTSIFAGLANKTDNPAAMQQSFDVITNPSIDEHALDDISSTLADAPEGSTGISNFGSRFVSDLFGDRTTLVNDVVAKSSGLRADSASSIMRFSAPLVIGFLNRQVRERGLNLSSFTKLLSDEKSNIMRAAPPGLASALGTEIPREIPRETESRAYTASRQTTPEPRSRPRWAWPVLAAVAALALFWAARGRSHPSPIVDTTNATAGGEVAPAPSPINAAPATTGGSTTSVTLPNGTTLSVVPTGIESRLAAFIADSSQRPNDSTWFDFDRLNFATKSATLLPTSNDQLANVAKILAAYPNVVVKIGGYTDNVGSPMANKRLSADRATNVRAVLVKDGIAANRLTAEGYGETHPVGDNTTDAGRAQNRRISLLVVKK